MQAICKLYVGYMKSVARVGIGYGKVERLKMKVGKIGSVSFAVDRPEIGEIVLTFRKMAGWKMGLKQILFVYLPPNSSNLKNGCICQFQHFHAVRFENWAELSGLVVDVAALWVLVSWKN